MDAIASSIREMLRTLSDTSLITITVTAGLAVFCIVLSWLRPRSDRRLAILEDELIRLSKERQTADGRLGALVSESLDRSGQSANATLARFAERLGRIDAAQTGLKALSEQVTGLERTLSNKQARGAFGEVRLSDLLRDALPASAFQEQATLPNGRRADALILLPSPPGPIAIDSKFPLERYLSMIDAPDKASETQAHRQFARDVAKHVTNIADRYILPAETADCALMFVPSEAVFAEIHASCRDVVEEGFRRRVYIVSPTTLWATLNTARAIMKDARIQEQSALLQQETLALVADVEKLATKAASASRRLALAEIDLADLSAAAKGAERRGRRIANLELDAEDNDAI